MACWSVTGGSKQAADRSCNQLNSRSDIYINMSRVPIPNKIIMMIANQLLRCEAFGSLASVAGLSHSLNDEIVPRLYRLVQLTTPQVISKFFKVFEPAKMTPEENSRRTMSDRVSAGAGGGAVERTYGSRHGYLLSLIRHLEFEISTSFFEHRPCQRSIFAPIGFW